MIGDILSSKKLNPMVTELFIRGRKLNIYLFFITKSYFSVPKNIRLNFVHYFIIKIPSKQELQKVAFNHSSDVEFKNFINFLVINCTLASDNPLRFRKKNLKT